MATDAITPIDLIRAFLVLALAVGQPLMGYWPEWRRWPETIATRSAALSTPAVPVGWAFAIWGPIFLWCLAFAVYHAWPSNLTDPLMRQMGWLAVAAFAGNIIWEFVIPKRGLGWPSVVIIVVELAILLTLVFVVLNAGPLGTAATWLVAAPFLLYAGWSSAATFVNLSSTAKGERFEPFGRDASGNAVTFVAGAIIVGASVAWFAGSWLYAAAIAWALIGIAAANRGAGGERAVRVVALVGIGIVLACGALSPRYPWLSA